MDEPAAEVVRQIFQMSVSGLGPTLIAKRLKADHVMTPTEYRRSVGRKSGACTERPYNWCSHTVANILDRQEYTGDTINFRSFSQSFKLKNRLDRPQEEWKVFPDTHPAIIDTIGLWIAPEPETLEQEYMAHYQAMQKRKKKTA